MPPKKVYVERGLGSGRRVQKGYVRSVYDTLTSPENSGMVTAITAFGVRSQLRWAVHSTLHQFRDHSLTLCRRSVLHFLPAL